jgi:TrpR-related protein YerC/YecD|tara:strand:- start:5130 stop:5465 length:336 start_codon:yes stop_codon:yes gene_type:complete
MPKQITVHKGESESDHLGQLCSAMMFVKSEEEMQRFLTDLCTPAEIRALTERWHVAKILDQQGLSYRNINEKTGVSTTTIGRVARFLTNEPHQGYRIILDRLSEESADGKD